MSVKYFPELYFAVAGYFPGQYFVNDKTGVTYVVSFSATATQSLSFSATATQSLSFDGHTGITIES